MSRLDTATQDPRQTCKGLPWILAVVLILPLPALLFGDVTGGSPVTQGPLEFETPLRFGRRTQLLVDNEVLCDWWKVRRVQQSVRKHPENPILQADQPWEETARQSWGCLPTAAVYDEKDGLYKLWYNIEQEKGGNVIGYAISRDGVHWTKPHLGLVEYAGSTANNLCRLEPFGRPVMGSIHLIQDPRNDAPDRRFKAIGIAPCHEDGTRYVGWLGIGHSPDGTTWRLVERGGLREGSGGGNPSCVWDEQLQRYVLFHRQYREQADPRLGSGRYIVRQESRDLIEWSARKTVFNPMDLRWPEVESMMVFRHPGIYFGLPQMLENEITGEVEVHLLTSRGGYHWNHPFPDEAFIPRGPQGDFDDMGIYWVQTVIHGDRVCFYYGGTRYPHSFSRGVLPEKRQGKIGMAWVPLDRLIGLRADKPRGAFLTRPFVVEGDELYVNANVDGELQVEVVDPVVQMVEGAYERDGSRSDGNSRTAYHEVKGRKNVYASFSRGDCEVVIGDSFRHRVHWKGGPIGKLKGKTVRLRFLVRLATVYAFQVQ